MSRYLWLCIINMSYLFADTLDKKKILEIIKAAKQHKVAPQTASTISATKTVVPQTKPVIVYRKKETATVHKQQAVKTKASPKELKYGTLPALAPSGKELQKKFDAGPKAEKKEMFLSKPHKTRETGMNTEAIRIEYNQR